MVRDGIQQLTDVAFARCVQHSYLKGLVRAAHERVISWFKTSMRKKLKNQEVKVPSFTSLSQWLTCRPDPGRIQRPARPRQEDEGQAWRHDGHTEDARKALG